MGNFFARQAVSYSRMLSRSCETLLGICAGLMADRKLNADEVLFLDQWLMENDAIANVWPGEVLAAKVRAVMADGEITTEELDHLSGVLSDLLGGTMRETGAAGGLSSKLPLDDVNEITISGSSFCFTGDFIFGTRDKCTRATEERGGEVLKNVRMDLDYLVIGTMVSSEWKHSSYGTKILKAVEYRDRGQSIRIIGENAWTKHL